MICRSKSLRTSTTDIRTNARTRTVVLFKLIFRKIRFILVPKLTHFLTAGADLLYNLAVYGLQFLLRGRLGLRTYLYMIIIPEMFYTVFITLIVYRLFRYINYRYMNIARKETWEPSRHHHNKFCGHIRSDSRCTYRSKHKIQIWI